ncbi:MAG: methyltransferase domain-containing protein [Planctomycetes bacterium]|nr:methyltransferase domain-containing protein [Planctomycetota bacterium]
MVSDPKQLRRGAVQRKYRAVSQSPENQFPYPVGRSSALYLGYPPGVLATIPAAAVDRFVGVGNPFLVHEPKRGDRVLDLGCGSGLDVFVAATLVGSQGSAVGVDLTTEMLARPGQCSTGHGSIQFLVADIERLPFADAAFDLILSNGVLNLVPDKDRAFREMRRVLRPGGILAAADLIVVDAIPAEVLEDINAWST